MQLFRIVTICLLVLLGLPKAPAEAQEARRRWERMNQIRTEKFDQILPEAMRENGIDMWITMIREATRAIPVITSLPTEVVTVSSERHLALVVTASASLARTTCFNRPKT